MRGVKTSIQLLAATLTVLLLLAACDAAAGPTPGADIDCAPVELAGPDGRQVDISGAWDANDGGVYYIKQIDSCVWWSGLSNFEGQEPGQEWVMTFFGRLDADARMRGSFVDVKGTNPGSGTMTIRVQTEEREGVIVTELYREEATGHTIGVTFWQRRSGDIPGEVPGPDQPPGEETPGDEPQEPGDEQPDEEVPGEDEPGVTLPPG
jgi:hypothetical protein